MQLKTSKQAKFNQCTFTKQDLIRKIIETTCCAYQIQYEANTNSFTFLIVDILQTHQTQSRNETVN